MQEQTTRTHFWIAWTVSSLLKLFVMLTLSPFGDEAFYAWESLRPAWVYSDIPGATAGLIRFSTTIFGDTLLGLRALFWLTGLLIPLLVVRIARSLGDHQQAWRAGLLALLLPLLQVLGVLALPDAALTLATLACVDALVRIQKRVSMIDCAQLALGLALGALSHYRFAPLLLAGAVGFFAAGMVRNLRDVRLLIALMLGAAAWIPLLLYNLQSDGAGVQFQLINRHPWSFDAKGLAHPVIQAVITTPVMYAMILWGLWRARGRNGRWALVWWSAFLPIVLYALSAAFVDRLRFSLHWPIQAYLIAIAMLPSLLDDSVGHVRALRWERTALLIAAPLALLIIIALAAAGQSSVVARTAGTGLYPDNFVGWKEVGAALKARMKSGDALVADHFMLAAQLSWQLDRRRVVYSLDHYNNHKHGRDRQLIDWGYNENSLDALPAGTPAWLIFEVEETPANQRTAWTQRVCRWFPSVQPIAVVHGPGDGKRFWIYRAVRAQSVATTLVSGSEVPPAINCALFESTR